MSDKQSLTDKEMEDLQSIVADASVYEHTGICKGDEENVRGCN